MNTEIRCFVRVHAFGSFMRKHRTIDDRSVRVRRGMASAQNLRQYLGRRGYAVAFLIVILTCTTLGAALSMVAEHHRATMNSK